MIFPKILAGEFLGGYIVRLALSNGLRGTKEVTLAAIDEDRLRTLDMAKPTKIKRGLTDIDLLRRHSVIAAILLDHQISHQRKPKQFAWLNSGTPQRMICPQCVTEDLDGLGFAYWRRDHQLPGSLVCGAHEVPLLSVPPSAPANGMPHHLLDRACAVPAQSVARHRGNCHVSKFGAILAHAVLRPAPERWEAARRKREILGLQKDGLEMSIRRAYPAEWLESVLPYAVMQPLGLRPVYTALTGDGISKVGIALIAALAYPSAHDAIAALYGETSQMPLFTTPS